MLQARQHANFADETQFAGVGARIRVQNLQGQLTLVPGVICKIDRSECALSDLALDFVSTGERNPEGPDWIGRTQRARHAVSPLLNPLGYRLTNQP